MKTRILTLAMFALLFVSQTFAQAVTTVRATSSDISDNLDLKAVASIFGDSRDLEDFERRLNDPDIQISNLDLNGDNRVDYLRVIEATENNTHLIIVQAVLGVDVYQDVATLELERDRSNNVVVQVVGDSYMYGPNYIYEPVYVSRPVIFDIFWVNTYRPYYSPWYWGYYPTYYAYWAPCPVYRYRNHIHHSVINVHNTYNYVTVRRSSHAAALYSSRRMNAYERQNPGRSFAVRTNAPNRYALEQTRTSVRNGGSYGNPSSAQSPRNTGIVPSRSTSVTNSRGYDSTVRTSPSTGGNRQYQGTRDVSNGYSPRNNSVQQGNTNSGFSQPRTTAPSTDGGRQYQPTRDYSNNGYSPRNSSVQPGNTAQPQVPQRSYSSPSSPVRSSGNMQPVRSAPMAAPSVRQSPMSSVRNTPAPAAPQRQAPSGGGGRNISRG